MADGGNVSDAIFYVGIDWGNTKHAVCVLDADGRIVKERFVDNDLSLLDVLAHATKSVDASEVAVAMEDRGNPVADTLLSHRYKLHVINPKQVDRFRDRESVAGAKDDRRDARVIARALRTDSDRFRVVEALTVEQVKLKVVCASLEELDAEHRRLANRLRAHLVRFFPALLTLSPGADDPWFWALVLLVGSPAQAAKVDDAVVAALLKKHRKRKHTVASVRAILDGKHLHPAEGVAEASLAPVRGLIERLHLLEKLRAEAATERDRLLDDERGPSDGAPSDVAILRSLDGFGNKTAAIMLVEARPLLRSNGRGLLRAIAGVAPVTRRSGKTTNIVMRRGCNARLRQCLHHVASSAARCNPRFAAQYQRLRDAGHSHARAVRGVADRILGMLCAMFRTRTLFDAKLALPN